MKTKPPEQRSMAVPGMHAPALHYTLVRSRRRSLSLCVERNGEVLVRAPLHASLQNIEQFLCDKRAWVERAQVQVLQAQAVTEEYLQAMAQGGEERAVLLVRVRKEARKRVTAAVQPRAEQLSLNYQAIKITSARTRWGSCSSRGTLSFTWRLALCPPEVLDYVAVHELCHLIHHNHSKAFWSAVAAACPPYKQHKRWLKEHRALLDVE